MAQNINDPEVERLATEVAQLAGETEIEAIRRALEERKARLNARLSPEERMRRTIEYMQREVWPHILPEFRGKAITKQEREEILGIGLNGYCE